MLLRNFIRNYPAASYFLMTFGISWSGALILVAPRLFSGQQIPKMDGILMFPVMLIGPVAASIILTSVVEGKKGLQCLRFRMGKWNIPWRWYLLAALIPPFFITITLFILARTVSPALTPNFFPIGILFGLPAGYAEEIGWTGYAFPQLRQKLSFARSCLLLGGCWGLWHLPVIDFLGAASPHGTYLVPFFLSFILVLMAMRILMMWIYTRTNSIPVVQLMHIISTGCLVVMGPSKVTSAQEALWYGCYAVVLWIGAGFILYRRRD